MVTGKPLRRWLIACTQIVISISLIVWIFLNIDLQNTIQLVVTTNIPPLIFCVISLAILVIPAAIRWHWFVGRFMPDGMVPPDLGLAIRINTVNVALNQFLPSTLGGDLYQGYHRKIAWFVVAQIYRSNGCGSAISICHFDRYFRASTHHNARVSWRHCLAVANYHMADVDGRHRVFSALLGFYPKYTLKFASAFALFQSFLRANGLISRVVFTSLIIQFVTLAVMIATAKILGIEIGVFSLFGIMAASLLASRLPISVAGWGVREGVLVSFLSAYGVAAEKAFATSVIYGLAELAAAMLALLIGSAVPGIF